MTSRRNWLWGVESAHCPSRDNAPVNSFSLRSSLCFGELYFKVVPFFLSSSAKYMGAFFLVFTSGNLVGFLKVKLTNVLRLPEDWVLGSFQAKASALALQHRVGEGGARPPALCRSQCLCSYQFLAPVPSALDKL